MESTRDQARKFRILGWVMAGAGVFLVVLMGIVTFAVADMVAESGSPGATTRYTGTPEEARAMFILFGVVIAMGLSALVAGIVQIRTGTVNKALSGLVAAMFAACLACAAWVSAEL